MGQINTNAALWENLRAVMLKEWGEENLNRLARSCKIGAGTAARIKEQKTSVGLETLEKIADHFHLAPWQLLVPGLDPENPPVIHQSTGLERKLYDRIMLAAKEIATEEPAARDLLK